MEKFWLIHHCYTSGSLAELLSPLMLHNVGTAAGSYKTLHWPHTNHSTHPSFSKISVRHQAEIINTKEKENLSYKAGGFVKQEKQLINLWKNKDVSSSQSDEKAREKAQVFLQLLCCSDKKLQFLGS